MSSALDLFLEEDLEYARRDRISALKRALYPKPSLAQRVT